MTRRRPRTVALCYGTRPQVIKASRLRRVLGATFRVLALDTGQHYDYALNALLYQQLGVAPPDALLEVGSGSQADQTAAVLTRAERQLLAWRPDAAVVIGDTNSTLGCALAAAKMRIPVCHVEAGLRVDDPLMPEEINRRVVDAIAGVLCAPSAQAAATLRAERPEATVALTGDIAYDVLLEQLPAAAQLPVPAPGYIFATLHRAELTDDPAALSAALAGLAALPRPVLLALHPRTRAALQTAGLTLPNRPGFTTSPAVGYHESVALTRSAAAVVTDSGGIQREAYWLGVPCVTMRGATEWTETVAVGANRLVRPHDAAELLAPAVTAAAESTTDWDRTMYGRGDAAEQIAAALGGG